MKTTEDFKALIPTIRDLFIQEDHKIGESYWDQDEDGWGKREDYTTNYFLYEEAGWYIVVTYNCCGEYEYDPGDYWTPSSIVLERAWGEVREIVASHYDEETDEETVFNDEDIKELWAILDGELKDIA